MKRLFGNFVLIVGGLLFVLTLAPAAQLKEARVTQIVSDVKLLPEQAAPRPAVVNDPVRAGTAVRTGTQSRSELTFNDLTITRLGANTIFSFDEGTRTMNLRDGAVLFQVPKGSGGATIKTAAVTAAITGTTGIGEYHPATATNPHVLSKWLCLEGTFHLILPNGQSVELGPGKMVSTNGESFSKVLTFDIEQVMATSLLVTGYDTTLASKPLIEIEQRLQLELKIAGGFVAVNSFAYLDPSDVVSAVDQGVEAEEANQTSPTATPTPPTTPTPTPGKFGALTVIASPDPYVITSGTTIQTDPTITTNGQTSFGKIWRGPAEDGPLSAFIFGSTSAFDTASGFDAELNGDMGGAGFKFNSLQLTGNPKISTAGGSVNLGLIAVNDITSGGPGGVLTFAGLRGLLLATQNGSITLGPEISFAGLREITFYARGSSSILTLASNVSTTNKIRLYGEGGIKLSSNLSTDMLLAFIGGDFDFTAGSMSANTISIFAGGDIHFTLSGPLTFDTTDFRLEADGNINVNDALSVSQTNTDQTEGLNISLLAGGAINIAGDLSLTNRTSNIDTGANILVNSGVNTTIGGALTLLVDNSGGSHIGTGGNILVRTGGDLTAGSVIAFVNNRNGGSILSGGNLTFNIGGALTTQDDAQTGENAGESLYLLVSTRNDGNGGGTIGSNVVLSLTAPSVSVAGNLLAVISTNLGGHVPAATLNIDISGNLVVQGNAADANTFGVVEGAFAAIENQGTFDQNGGLITGGTIGSDAIINLRVSNIPSADLDVEIDNLLGGHIGRDALIRITVPNTINTQGDVFFGILNSGPRGAAAGFIGRNAAINVNANSISIGGFFKSVINDTAGGHIGGDATIDVGVTGDLTAQTGILARITETGFVSNTGFVSAGQIGGNAILTLSARNIMTPSTASGTPGVDTLALEAAIYTNLGGTVGGDAIVNVLATQNISTPGTVFFSVANGNFQGLGAAIIGRDAKTNVSASNVSTGALFDDMYNYGGSSIGRDAIISLNVSNSFTATGNAEFAIFSSGGNITRDASITVTAADISAPSLTAEIDNSQSGTIGGNAAINFSVSGNSTITNDASFQIFGSDGAAASAINFNGGNYAVGGTFLSTVDGDGMITFNNASIHADVLKVGAFGANGLLNIGGGTLSADTTLKLYAPGSSGEINFVSNVTLSSGSGTILAAQRITIQPTRVVTIAGNGGPAQIYTNDPNYNFTPQPGYTGPRPNPANGSFGGLGADDPQPLSNAPVFGSPPSPPITPAQSRGNITARTLPRSHVPLALRVENEPQIGNNKGAGPAVRINNSGELLSLLDRSSPGSEGQITVSASNRRSNARHPSRRDGFARLNEDRATLKIQRDRSLPATRLR